MNRAQAAATANHLPTSFFLLAQYGGRATLTLDEVCRDFFAHLSPEQLVRKVQAGSVHLVVTRMEASQKAAKVVMLSDLADYLDRQREFAKRELAAVTGS